MSMKITHEGGGDHLIDLRLLQAFIAVAEEGTIGGAARRLSIAQSPLSRKIMRLESTLGVRLLERERTGVRMTGAGRVLFREGLELLALTERIAQHAREAGCLS